MHAESNVLGAIGTVNPGDTSLLLISAALVLLMTPGLAFFYGGLVRHKNVLTIMLQSFISMGIVTVLWVVCGFSLAYGPDHGGIIGDFTYIGLRDVGMTPGPSPYAPTTPFLAFFLFQLMFAIITPALITGAFADRVGFKAYLWFLVIWSFLVYIPFVHWIWGGGFLQHWGAHDFAGGMVVHLSSGMAALASVFVVGSRIFRQNENRLPNNIPFVALGAGLLWFGWFGFNGGSELAANGQAAVAFVNTNTAASVGMVTWLFIAWWHTGKASMSGALTGAVAGLATITPAAGFVPTWAALSIGFAAGAVCYLACQFRLRMKWDDALDVWGVHGVGGALGTILTGVFAIASINGMSGLIDGDAHQFGIQIGAVAITATYAFVVTFIILKVIGMFMAVRVSEGIERDGLDDALHGEAAYQPLPVMVAGVDGGGVSSEEMATPGVQ